MIPFLPVKVHRILYSGCLRHVSCVLCYIAQRQKDFSQGILKGSILADAETGKNPSHCT